MKSAGIAELKAKLSAYLARVKAGEEILVTEHNVPVARIVPIGEHPADLRAAQDLERRGLLRLGTGKLPPGFWKLRRARDPDAVVRQAVAEERSSGW